MSAATLWGRLRECASVGLAMTVLTVAVCAAFFGSIFTAGYLAYLTMELLTDSHQQEWRVVIGLAFVLTWVFTFATVTCCVLRWLDED